MRAHNATKGVSKISSSVPAGAKKPSCLLFLSLLLLLISLATTNTAAAANHFAEEQEEAERQLAAALQQDGQFWGAPHDSMSADLPLVSYAITNSNNNNGEDDDNEQQNLDDQLERAARFSPASRLLDSIDRLDVGGGGGGDRDKANAGQLDGDEWGSSDEKEEIFLLEDKDYPKSLFEDYSKRVGQVSGIATLPTDDVAIFHRSTRQWTESTFSRLNNSSEREQKNLIANNTITILHGDDGSALASFGANLFYLPHSIASDSRGNLWLSDVARHQVMRLPTSELLRQLHGAAATTAANGRNYNATTKLAIPLWPDIILGEAFESGNDEHHFCQPTSIVVSPDDRLVYIADGYCNQRVMVFTGQGAFVGSFGTEENMAIVHSLSLMVERNLLCVGDRENSRLHCYRAGLDGDLASLGQLIHSIDYPLGRIFATASLSPNHMLVSSSQLQGEPRYHLAILNPFTRQLKLVWTSSDLLEPHALASTTDRHYAYAADVSKDAYKKVFKFDVIERKTFS